MRFLHTADWHLGRTLRGHDLLADQVHALEQVIALANTMAQEPLGLQGILIAGDLYDRFHPSAPAMALLGQTLAQLAAIAPVFAIPGNHDSAERVGYAADALQGAQIHMAGPFSWPPRIITLPAQAGSPPVDVVLMPYLEPAAVAPLLNLTPSGIPDRPLGVNETIETHEDLWCRINELWEEVLPRDPARLRILVAHAFVRSGISEASERSLVMGRIHVGGADTVSAETLLGDRFQYAALGHLHRPQQAGPEGRVRYPGSLLAYSVDEGSHDHGVVEVVFRDSLTAPEIAFHPIHPRRQVRIVTGDAQDIRGQADSEVGPRRQDYVLFRFPSREAQASWTLSGLRDIYPNTLGLEIQDSAAKSPVCSPSPEIRSSLPEISRSPEQWAQHYLDQAVELGIPVPEAAIAHLTAALQGMNHRQGIDQ
jgi:exonuclease SbcD